MDNDEVLQDFRRRWEDTYVWLKMKSKATETLVHVRAVERNEDKIGTIHLESGELGALTINMGSADHSLKFKYPQSGVFQYKNHAAYFRRRPSRQWKRGLCVENSTVRSVVTMLTGNTVPYNVNTLQSAFDHKVFSKSMALELLESNRAKSVALSDNLSLSLSMTDNPDYMIFFWDHVIGRCSNKGEVTILFDKVMDEICQRVLG